MRMKKNVGGFLCLLLLVGCQSAKRNPAMDLMRSASYLEDYDVQIGYENAERCFFKYHSVYYMNLADGCIITIHNQSKVERFAVR